MSRRLSERSSLFGLLKACFLNHGVQHRRIHSKSRSAAASLESLESRLLLSATEPRFVENRILLGLTSPDAQLPLESLYPGSDVEPLGNYGVYLMTLPTGTTVIPTISDLTNRPGVKYAEPDWISELTATPNDPDFNRMWGWRNIGQTVNGVNGTLDADIAATEAWDTATGSPGVLVAIIDSGIDYNHPDLDANVWTNPGEIAGNGVDDDSNGYVDDVRGYDFIDRDADPMDTLGHGTHVAGTVGAVGNNGIGTVGVNWNVQMMALRIFDTNGSTTLAAIIESINYAVDMGALVSNNSYGGYGVNTRAFEDAIIYAQANNHIFVAAAGNNASDNDAFPFYPASFPQDNVVAVAATDQNDQLAGFSNYGLVNVDIGAPGVNIWSPTPVAGSTFYGPNYDFSDGTSMASPAVAGAIAMLRSLAPSLPYTTIIAALYAGSDKIASMNGVVSTGGRLNLDKAIQQLKVASIIVTPPSVAENAGTSAAFITIRKLAWPLDTDLVLDLSFDDATEVAVPALVGGSTITIPAGQAQIVLPINVLDDTLLDGTQTVTFDLQFAGASVGIDTLLVTDVENISLTLNPASILENAGIGAGTVTVTRTNTDTLPLNTYIVQGDKLDEYSYLGTLVSSRTIPWPTGSRPPGEQAHDLVMLQNGKIAVYNGTTTGYISIFDPKALTWQHFFIPGLSTDAGDVAKGGITSWGNYVFVSDMESTTGNAFGVVRLDLTTGTIDRFATKSLDYRMFVKDLFGDNILEVDPVTGTTRNILPMPVPLATNNGFNNGLAFDGTNLWVLAGGIGNDQVYRLNADTGAVIDIHHLGGTTEWDGLAWLNGFLYALDNDAQNRIHVYNPAARQVIKTLNVGALNNVRIGGGLSGFSERDSIFPTSAADSLFVTSADSDEIFEISPSTGLLLNRWNSGAASTELGLAVANNEVYIGEFGSGELRIFNRAGVLQRVMDVVLSPSEGVFALGGDNLIGTVTTPYRYRDVFAGLDDQLYVLDNAGLAVGRYNPTTLALDRFFNVSNQINALAVAVDGTIWGAGANGTLYHFSGTGALLGSLVTGVAELIDIDLNVTGQILLTSRVGLVLQTNTAMATPTSFSVATVPAFVTLGRHQTLPAGDVIVTLSSSDTSELRVPLQVIIPIGQQSVTVPIDAVDDNILDGLQTVIVTATATGYVGSGSDTIDVLDAELVAVDIIAPVISEAAGNNATSVRVYRTNVDGPFPYLSTQQFSNTDPSTILDFDKVRSYITIPSQTSRISDVNITLSLTHGWLADLDMFLVSPNGTRVELVTDLNNNQTFMTDTTFDDQALGGILAGMAPFTGSFRPEGLLGVMNGLNPSGVWTLEITDDNQFDFGTLLSWSMQIQTTGLAPMTVQLAIGGDPNEISLQTTVMIPANQSEIIIPLHAIDDSLLDGTQTATVTPTSINATGFLLGGDSVQVTDLELLTFTVDRTTVSEAAGAGAVIGTLRRFNTDLSLSFTVALSSSDTSELTVQATATILAGQTSVTFPINAIDDALIDGSQTVTITASAPAYGADLTRTMTVQDLEPSLGLSTNTPVVREDGASLELTVTRLDQADLSQPKIVTLVSVNVPGGGALTLNVPGTVTIPIGATSVTFAVTIVDDTLLDGTQVAQVTASGAGIISGSILINVTDHETLTVTTDKTEFLESAGAKAAKGTVRRSNTNVGSPLVVTLTSSDLSELTVPVTVTIPAGAASVDFDIAAVNDPVLDGPQSALISASAAGYIGGSRGLTVLDHEPPVILTPGATTVNPLPTITWGALPGAIRYELLLSNLSSGVNQLIYNTAIIGTQFTPTEKLGIGRYRVWVRAIDVVEMAGFWSFPKDFKIDTAPTITAPTTAGPTASATFPEISWTEVTDAARYELWVNNLTTGQARVITQTNLVTTSYLATEVLGSGSYNAFVRAFNASGEFGQWSVAKRFAVLAAPAIVTPTTGGTFDRTPTFTWTAIPGATNYDIWVSSRTTNAVVIRNQFVTATTLTAATDLANGNYTVWVRAQNGSQFSAWSAPRLFSVGTPPTITSPAANGTTGNKPTIVWSSITGTGRYELWVTNVTTNVRVLYLTNLTTTNFTATTALAAGPYRVWVRAVSTMGETTAWSTDVKFTVAAVSLPSSGTPDSGSQLLATAIKSQLDQSLTEPDAIAGSVHRSMVTAGKTSAAIDDSATTTSVVVRAVFPSVKSMPVDSDAEAHDSVMADWHASAWWMAGEKSRETATTGHDSRAREAKRTATAV